MRVLIFFVIVAAFVGGGFYYVNQNGLDASSSFADLFTSKQNNQCVALVDFQPDPEIDDALPDKSARRAILAEPADVTRYLDYAELLLSDNQLEDAVLCIEDGIKNEETRSEAFLLRAKANYGLKKYDRALSDVRAAVKSNPNAENAWRYFGDIAQYLNDDEALFEAGGGYTKNFPNSAFGYYDIAAAYILRGEYENALSFYEEYARRRESPGRVHLFRGKAYRAMGRFQEALEQFTLAEQVVDEREEGVYLEYDLSIERACIAALDGRHEFATGELKTLIYEKNFRSPRVKYCYGIAKRAAGDETAAMLWFERAIAGDMELFEVPQPKFREDPWVLRIKQRILSDIADDKRSLPSPLMFPDEI